MGLLAFLQHSAKRAQMVDFILANYVCNLEAARVAARGPRAVRHSHLPGVWPEVRGDANARDEGSQLRPPRASIRTISGPAEEADARLRTLAITLSLENLKLGQDWTGPLPRAATACGRRDPTGDLGPLVQHSPPDRSQTPAPDQSAGYPRHSHR